MTINTVEYIKDFCFVTSGKKKDNRIWSQRNDFEFGPPIYWVALVIFYIIKPQLYFLEEKSEQYLPKKIIVRIKQDER